MNLGTACYLSVGRQFSRQGNEESLLRQHHTHTHTAGTHSYTHTHTYIAGTHTHINTHTYMAGIHTHAQAHASYIHTYTNSHT